MRKKPSDPLRGQVQTLVAAADAAAGWFQDGTPALLSAARTARLRSRSWRELSVAAARTRGGPAKADISEFSFSLREVVEQTVAAVSEAARLGLPLDEEMSAAAAALRLAARSLLQATAVAGPARAQALAQAKGYAAEADRRRRDIGAAARASTLFIASIKRGEIAGLLGGAAEALQRSCDALAGSLAE